MTPVKDLHAALLAHVRANYSYLNELPGAIERIFEQQDTSQQLDREALRMEFAEECAAAHENGKKCVVCHLEHPLNATQQQLERLVKAGQAMRGYTSHTNCDYGDDGPDGDVCVCRVGEVERAWDAALADVEALLR